MGWNVKGYWEILKQRLCYIFLKQSVKLADASRKSLAWVHLSSSSVTQVESWEYKLASPDQDFYYSLYFTFPTSLDNLRANGKHPHTSLMWSRYCLVVQSSYVSSFWHLMTSGSNPIKDSVTSTFFRMLRLYWPAPVNTALSKSLRFKV